MYLLLLNFWGIVNVCLLVMDGSGPKWPPRLSGWSVLVHQNKINTSHTYSGHTNRYTSQRPDLRCVVNDVVEVNGVY